MADLTSAVAKREQAMTNRSRFIEQLGPQIARALPAHLSGDRVTRLALTAVRQTPKLAETDQMSFAGALLTAAALGLEPNTPTGEAYLVPYGSETQLIVGYQGMIKLFWQHPMAAGLTVEAVYEADEFDEVLGTGGYLRHKKNRTVKPADKGTPVLYYAHARLSTGAEQWVVLTPDEVKKLRSGREGPSGKIDDPQRWMEKKTCIRQLFKLIPKTANMQTALHVDEKHGAELYKAHAERATDPAPEPQHIERLAVNGAGAADEVHADVVDTQTGEIR
jgi:recombination protein RecT